MGGGDLLYAGIVGWGRGEWGIGVQLQASYRFVDGDHYATFGGSISVRFPAGIGVGYVTALAIAEGASSSRGSSSSGSRTSTTTTQGTPASAPFGFCEHPHPYVSPDEPAPAPVPDRWLCRARSADERDHEEGPVRAPDRDHAVELCRQEFVVAHADGARCDCELWP
jgi:hypothetical protein